MTARLVTLVEPLSFALVHVRNLADDPALKAPAHPADVSVETGPATWRAGANLEDFSA